MKILIVEDNKSIGKGLKYFLIQENYEVELIDNYTDALKELNNKYNLVILDVNLPDGNGFDLFENVIKEKNIPTIFLTAKDDEDDIVHGLNSGAEDYITKPFSTKELLARINRILMREQKKNIVKVKDISFDVDKMCVYKNDNKVELTSLELKLLYLLFINLNKVVKRATILDTIWEITGNDVDDHTVTVYFKRIREKLDTDIIKTIKGIGYLIDEE